MKVEKAQVAQRLAQFQAAARTAGVKLTHQRLEIFREVASSLEHPSAETVFRAVQTRMPTVSLDTVYRTLWTLHDLGLLSTLGPRRESVRFDSNLEPHHHYVCIRCGRARDFESPQLNTIRVPSAAKRFGRVVSTHVAVRGICDTCTKRGTPKPVRQDPQPASRRDRRET
jgi:Fur family peroxide stress response transcriptional regulator